MPSSRAARSTSALRRRARGPPASRQWPMSPLVTETNLTWCPFAAHSRARRRPLVRSRRDGPRSRECVTCRRPAVPRDGRPVSVRSATAPRSSRSTAVQARPRIPGRQAAEGSCNSWDALLSGLIWELVCRAFRNGRSTAQFIPPGDGVKRPQDERLQSLNGVLPRSPIIEAEPVRIGFARGCREPGGIISAARTREEGPGIVKGITMSSYDDYPSTFDGERRPTPRSAPLTCLVLLLLVLVPLVALLLWWYWPWGGSGLNPNAQPRPVAAQRRTIRGGASEHRNLQTKLAFPGPSDQPGPAAGQRLLRPGRSAGPQGSWFGLRVGQGRAHRNELSCRRGSRRGPRDLIRSLHV